MKHFLLFSVIMLLSYIQAFSQTTLLTEGFETDGEGSRYTSTTFSDCASSDYFLWTNDNGPFSSCGTFGGVLSNVQGSYFWVAEDIESTANPNATFSTLTLNSLNVTGYSSITVSLFMATGRTGTHWEYSDSIKIQTSWDGGSFTTIGQFVGDGEFGGYLRQDTDLDGVADGGASDIPATFTNFTFNVPGIGTNLKVRVRLCGLDGSEEFAFDQIVVQGSSTPPSNYAPVLASIETDNLLFTEGDSPLQVSNTITVSDIDDTDLSGAIVSICSGFNTSEDVLSFSPEAGIGGTYDPSTGILTFSGAASLASYQSIFQSVTYQNTNTSNPSNTPREICFTANDGTDNSNTLSRTINIMDVITDVVCIPFAESFESDGEGITYVSNTFDDSPSSEFFFRTNTQPAGHAESVSGIDGSYFWASEDVMSGSNGTTPGLIEFAPMTITGNSSFTVTIAMGTSNNIGTRWENTDNIYLQYNIDGAGWNTFGLFEGDDEFGGDLRVDLDNDPDTVGGGGPYGATVPNGSVSDFEFNFTGSGDVMKIRIKVEQDGGSEELVFDNIRVSGDVTVPALCKDITVYLDNAGIASIVPTEISLNVLDACGADSLAASATDFTCDSVGDRTVVLTVFDAVGNTSTCNATVTVMDTIPPTPICINGLAIELDPSGSATVNATDLVASPAAEACGPVSYSLSDSVFTCADKGTNVVQLTASDASGNSDYCETYILVQDNLVVTNAVCKDTTVYLDINGMASISPADVDGGSTVPCGIDTMFLDSYDFSCSNVGNNTVQLTVKDLNSNQSTCNATVTIADTIVPGVETQDIMVYLTDSGTVSILASEIDNGSSDACGIDTMYLDTYDFSCSDIGANTVTLTATDINGNTNSATATVTVTDSTTPVYTGKEKITFYASDSTCDAHVSLSSGQINLSGSTGEILTYSETFTQNNTYYIGSSEYDNWGNIRNQIDPEKVLQIRASSSISPEKLVLDDAELAKQIAQAFKDGTGLTVIAPDGNKWTIGIGCQVGSSNVSASDAIELNVNTNYNCSCSGDPTSITFRPCIGNNNWGGFGTQTCGASTQTLRLEIISGPDISYTDNCTVTRTLISGLGDTADYPLGITTNTYRLEDEQGNFILQDIEIEVIDTVQPNVVCNNLTAALDENGALSIAAHEIDGGSTDNCAIDSLWISQTDFDCANLGDNFVTLYASDISGNIDSCQAIVTVNDNTKPIAVCKNITVNLGQTGNASITASQIDGGSSDNCGIDSMWLDNYDFTLADLGIRQVTLFVADASGNQSSCTASLKIVDNTPPMAVCNTISINLDDDGKYTFSDEELLTLSTGSTDNVTAPEDLVIEAKIIGSRINCTEGEIYVYTEIYVTDEDGNTGKCGTWVEVLNGFELLANQIKDIEVTAPAGTCETTIDYPKINTESTCAEFTLLSGLGPNGVFPVGTTEEKWLLTNPTGDSLFVSFLVTVTADNLPPTLDMIMDVDTSGHPTEITIPLGGISFGADCAAQDIMIAATGVNSEVVSTISITYASPDSTGELMLTIPSGATGSDSITVSVEDSEGGLTTQSFVVTINYANQAPVLMNAIADQQLNADHVIKIPFNDSVFIDYDGDTLLIEFALEDNSALPAWLSLMNDTLYVTPSIADTGCISVVITASDPSDVSVSDTFKVCVEGFMVGTNEIGLNELNMNMFPNPSKGLVTLEFDAQVTGDIEVLVTDITGKQVLKKSYLPSQQINFNLSDQVSGMYFVNVQVEDQHYIRKLILNRR